MPGADGGGSPGGTVRGVDAMTSPVFIMPTLGRRGRFANQLFQYAYLRIAAEKRGAIVQTPAWSGQELFGFRDPLVEEGTVAATVKDWTIDDNDLYLNRDEPIGDRVEFRGFFQCHSRHFLPHREFLRRLFVFRPDLRRLFDEVVARLREGGRPLVAAHLRRGDYGEGQFFRAPVKWYADWLDSAAAPRDPALYLCSEAPETLVEGFKPRSVMHAGLLPNLSPGLAYILDFYVLTQADALAISNSSFSFMAAMLNARATTFVRPCLDERRLLAFDPWDAPILFPRHLRPGEQAELDALDAATAPATADCT